MIGKWWNMPVINSLCPLILHVKDFVAIICDNHVGTRFPDPKLPWIFIGRFNKNGFRFSWLCRKYFVTYDRSRHTTSCFSFFNMNIMFEYPYFFLEQQITWHVVCVCVCCIIFNTNTQTYKKNKATQTRRCQRLLVFTITNSFFRPNGLIIFTPLQDGFSIHLNTSEDFATENTGGLEYTLNSRNESWNSWQSNPTPNTVTPCMMCFTKTWLIFMVHYT